MTEAGFKIPHPPPPPQFFEIVFVLVSCLLPRASKAPEHRGTNLKTRWSQGLLPPGLGGAAPQAATGDARGPG